MSGKSDTWMPLYIGDYLSDTMRLTTVEHGAYFLLLMEYWKGGPLPDDDAALAHIARLDRRSWDKGVGPTIRRFFSRHDDGLLHQKRVDAERTKAARISEKRRAAVSQRADRNPTNAIHTGNKSATNEPTNVEQLNTHARVAVPSPSPKKEDSELRSAAMAAPIPIRDLLWSDGLPVIRSLVGLSDGQARGFLGRLLKAARDDCGKVHAVLREADSLRPADPKAWLMNSCTPLAERGSSGRPDPWANLFPDDAHQHPEYDLEMTPDDHGAYDLPRV